MLKRKISWPIVLVLLHAVGFAAFYAGRATAPKAEAEEPAAETAGAETAEAKAAEAKAAETKPETTAAVAKPTTPPTPPAPAKAAPAPAAPAAPTGVQASDVDRKALGQSPYKGAADPLVQVLICTDFQCPVCSRAAREMEPLFEELGAEVRFELKNSALEMHRNAKGAAIAGLAAFRQGMDNFWKMHDAMFADQRALEELALFQTARRIGLNMEKFKSDFEDPAVAKQVEAESALCMALGARGTPAFFINGERHIGWGSTNGFRSMILRQLKLAKEALAAGTPRDQLVRTLVKKYATEPAKFTSLVLDNIPADASK